MVKQIIFTAKFMNAMYDNMWQFVNSNPTWLIV